ncbi:Ferredoxin [Symbiodinium natans]|uniref:Ferredoxin protein n=1 Tax=Symbiodinium natans TaxID=878477 RepID=A0A812JJC7_9DINO|nr:Ferredoxin [Symbiodinium natans]
MPYRTIAATPENRRAFVQHFRKQLSQVTRDVSVIALTAQDFHDMVVMLCPDFPLDLIIDAADFVPPADTQSHRFLGQRSPVASVRGDDADPSPDSADLVLFPMIKLQRMVEFRFVYPEVFRSVKDLYKRQGQSAFALDAAVSRITLVRHLRDVLFGTVGTVQIALRGAALPSEGALQKLLQGKRGLLEGFSEELSLSEAMRDMAASFELIPSSIPAQLLLKATVPGAKREPAKEEEGTAAAAAEDAADREAAEVLSAPPAAEAAPSFAQGAARTSLRLAERRRIERTASGSLLRSRAGKV